MAFFAVLSLLAMSFPLAAQTPASKPIITLKLEHLVGKLERVDLKQNTVGIRLEKELRLIHCTPDCRVFNDDGKLAKLADLRLGTPVEVSCVESHGEFTAQRITPVAAYEKDAQPPPKKK